MAKKKKNIMKEFKIVLRTLQRIVKAEDKIRKDAAALPSSRKRERTGRYEEVDAAMEKWFAAARNQKLIVTGSHLIKKAKDRPRNATVNIECSVSSNFLGVTELLPLKKANPVFKSSPLKSRVFGWTNA